MQKKGIPIRRRIDLQQGGCRKWQSHLLSPLPRFPIGTNGPPGQLFQIPPGCPDEQLPVFVGGDGKAVILSATRSLGVAKETPELQNGILRVDVEFEPPLIGGRHIQCGKEIAGADVLLESNEAVGKLH